MQPEAGRLRITPPAVRQVLQSDGIQLPSRIQLDMARWLGRDLRDVRIHTGSAAASAARAVHAEAFAAGRHVVFGIENLFPLTTAGNQLLAHELIHVAQDPGPTHLPLDRIALSQPWDAAEKQAESAAQQMVRPSIAREHPAQHSANATAIYRTPPPGAGGSAVATPRRARAADVTLIFFPGLLEIEIFEKGRYIETIQAWGGPPTPTHDPSGTRMSPTAPGTFTLGRAEPHISRFWPASQIPWGAALSDDGTTVSFFDTVRGRWIKTTDLGKPFTRTDILTTEQLAGRPRAIPSTWDLNDFGPLALQVEGTAEFIHTTPDTELGGPLSGPSHGCIHIMPANRDAMIAKGYLQAGVKLIVKSYADVATTPGP